MTRHNSQFDFLATWYKELNFIQAVVELAEKIKQQPGQFKNKFTGELAVSIFRDNSTRTRYSFAAAAGMLGLTLFDFAEKQSQISHGETVAETANMIGFETRALGIRDDIFLGVGHKFMVDVATGLDWGFANKVLAKRPTVVNLQSDEDHPTQAVSDLTHLKNYWKGWKNLRGKKITISWAYSPSYGKPLSVPQGAISLFSRMGMEVNLAYPKGYELIPEIQDYAKKATEKSRGKFKITHDMKEAFRDADAVYPKSWAPYSVMVERTKLLQKGATQELAKLEKQALNQNATHKNWTCTEELMKLTNHALYLHCLPADITGVSCKQGEVEEKVFTKFRKDVYEQASFKPYVIAAMILLCQSGIKSNKQPKLK